MQQYGWTSEMECGAQVKHKKGSVSMKRAERQCCSECSGCWFPLGVKGLKEDRQGLPGTGDVLFLEPGVGYTGVFTL